jgi:FeS assembly SUF system regulator
MIRITKQTDYGIVLLSLFARGHGGRIYTARDLANEARIGLPMVSKILKLLVHAGLLVSQRGVKGGYHLARDPGRITIADILAALEGPVALTECSSDSSDCQVESSCPVRKPWTRINDAIREALERVTLAEMTCPVADPVCALSERGAPQPELV